MANSVFYYYYAPTWDCPPDGPIKLGNVLTSIKKPEQPLYTAPPPTASEIFSSEKTKVEHSNDKLREGKFSILTKFMSILGVGVDVSANWKNSDDALYTFERVETTQFVPKDDYIQKCIEAVAVRRHLDRCRYRKPVYIITGLKTVYGANANSHTFQTHGSKIAGKVDGAVLSSGTAPVSVEPGFEVKTEAKNATAWEGSSDFVFAFRVRKVHVNKKTQAVDHNDDYKKGALLGDTIETEEDFPELFITSQEDPKAEDEGYDEDKLMEGETVVACAVPKAKAPGDEE